MKKFLILLTALVAQKNFSQNSFPTTGSVNFDTSLKIGTQVAAPHTPGEITRLSLTPYGHTGGPWNFKTRDIFSTAFLDIDYGTIGTVLTVSSDKNVGIGIINPSQKLEVNGNGSFKGAIISSISDNSGGQIHIGNPSKISNGTASTWMIYNMTGNYGNSLQFWAYDNLGCAGGMCSNRFTIMDNGNVGIGTMISDSKLDVSTDLPSQGRYDSQKWSVKNENYDLKLQTIWNTQGINQEFIQRYNGVNYTSLAFYKGKIGIGTSVPDEQLTVNGKIHAQEVRIDLSSPMTVPDYVFSNDYKLKSLQEVENYIKENSHLPEIPSAKEIEKNGLMLAEMNMSLLKKVEELTLYAIEQEKKTEKLNLYIIEQNKIISEQNRRLDKLER